MKDRLEEFQILAGFRADGEKGKEIGQKLLPEKGNDFQQFLIKCDSIHQYLIQMSDEQQLIEEMGKNLLKNVGNDPIRSKQMSDASDRFIQKARLVQEKLQRLHNDYSRCAQKNGCGTDRAKEEQLNVLRTKFQNVMMTFNETHLHYKENAAKKIENYLKMQNIEVSHEQIDEAIESGNLANLTRNVHLGLEAKKSLYDDVKTRAGEILLIEKQIREIAELFHDTHLLIVRQGEVVDRIETSVMNAREYATNAETNVKQAVVMRRRNNKLRIAALLCSAILIVILLVFLQSIVCFYTPLC